MQETFQFPVVAADGKIYERAAIIDWFAKSSISPMTNVLLAHKELHSAHETQLQLDRLLALQAEAIVDESS